MNKANPKSKKNRTAKSREKYFLICPRCNSKDVSTDFSNPALVGTGLINNAKVCHNCGYSANFFPEIQSSAIPPIKKITKKDKFDRVNTTYGKTINWFWRIVGPVFIIAAVICLFFYYSKAIFYIGLLYLLPLGCMLTLTGYRNDLIQKYKSLRILSIIIYIYSITLAPIFVVILAA